MKRCEHCGGSLKLSAQGTMHPLCAVVSSFQRIHGGTPLFCESRDQARKLAKSAVDLFEDERSGNLKTKTIDAGKDRTHPGSNKFIKGGTRWAVCVEMGGE